MMMGGKRRGLCRTGLAIIAASFIGTAALGLLFLWRDSSGGPPHEVVYQRHPAGIPTDDQLPDYARATPELTELYLFALLRPDVLTYIPCTCGCRSIGHHSSWNCYIRSVAADGTVVFDDMAPA